LSEIPQTAQLFTCNSLKGICPVAAIDEHRFPRDFDWEKSFSGGYKQLIREFSKELILA
jgi:hypothetical protein